MRTAPPSGSAALRHRRLSQSGRGDDQHGSKAHSLHETSACWALPLLPAKPAQNNRPAPARGADAGRLLTPSAMQRTGSLEPRW